MQDLPESFLLPSREWAEAFADSVSNRVKHLLNPETLLEMTDSRSTANSLCKKWLIGEPVKLNQPGHAQVWTMIYCIGLQAVDLCWNEFTLSEDLWHLMTPIYSLRNRLHTNLNPPANCWWAGISGGIFPQGVNHNEKKSKMKTSNTRPASENGCFNSRQRWFLN